MYRSYIIILLLIISIIFCLDLFKYLASFMILMMW